MTIEITSNKAGLATVLVTEGAEGMTHDDMRAVVENLRYYGRVVAKMAEESDGSGADLCDLYEDAKVVGQLAAALRRYCHQWQLAGL